MHGLVRGELAMVMFIQHSWRLPLRDSEACEALPFCTYMNIDEKSLEQYIHVCAGTSIGNWVTRRRNLHAKCYVSACSRRDEELRGQLPLLTNRKKDREQ